MPFSIQDLARFLINPLIPAFAILFIQVLKKQQSRRLLVVLFLYLYVVTTPLISKLATRVWTVEDTVSYARTYDAVVALTGMASSGWYLSRKDNPFTLNCYYRFGSNADRIIAAAEFLQAGHARKLLFGDLRTESFSEASVVVDFLEKQGIPHEQIVIYGEVSNTRDEACKVRQYFEAAGLRELVLVTSESHMRRAAALFNMQGLYPDLLSVSRTKKDIRWKDFIPGNSGLVGTKGMLYEIVAYIGYFSKGEIL